MVEPCTSGEVPPLAPGELDHLILLPFTYVKKEIEKLTVEKLLTFLDVSKRLSYKYETASFYSDPCRRKGVV